MNVNSQQIQTVVLKNQYIPDEGPLAGALILDFTAADDYEVDLAAFMDQAKMSMVQTLFIDCADSNVNLTININGAGGQRIIAKAKTQGFYTALTSNPASFTFSCPGGPIMKIFVINTPIPGTVWSTT